MASGVTFRWRLRLPETLPVPTSILVRRTRVLWAALLALVIAVQLAGFAFALFDAYRIRPAMRAVGLAIEYGDQDQVVARPLRTDVAQAGVAVGAQIEKIGGQVFAPSASLLSLTRALMAMPGDQVSMRLRNHNGQSVAVSISRSSNARLLDPPSPLSVDLRMSLRLFSTLLCSLSLLGSSCLLLIRRPDDPEAMLFGLGFLVTAACVDPVLPLWMAMGAGFMIDALAGIWWTLLVVALAAFPDGRFTPSALRWSVIVAPLLGLLLASDRISNWLSLTIAIGIPLLLLAAQVSRYRKLGAGRERQQIKWAALGFAIGFVLAGISLAMSLAPYDAWRSDRQAIWTLATVCLFNLAFAVLPLGLLISLVRFRLWEVDRVISRSVALALVTTLVGLLWAVLSDIAKLVVAYVLGKEHDALALGLGAALVACVFAPTQAAVVRWCKRRFNPTGLDLEQLPERISAWRAHCDAAEVATRALDVTIGALHAPGGAIFVRTPKGRTLLASRELAPGEAAHPPALVDDASGGHVLPLEDQDGLAGWLMVHPRDDGSRFSKSDLAALSALAAPLAETIRSAPPASRNDPAAHDVLNELRQRIAILEQSAPRPV